MVTICFTPRLLQGFSSSRNNALRQYRLFQLPLTQSAVIVYNTIISQGPLNSVADIKLILNNKFNFYDIVNKHITDLFWEREFRPPTPYELSDLYELVISSVHYLTQDVFEMMTRCTMTLPLIQRIEIQDDIGHIYV